ncbi:LacI family DNA-binding transcriptional regulator [Microlunatus flavus]|uniref:DNA-binding transcriptional regulator, LacI/PurR family n=1 Tax=Microlunatus flavus TaxID=1036181 RepID=A0A1H9ALU3_9ACTN|nr:LacI family DNA-binding transcriptional regulator [Microlunatus flavus]SEP77639.1 DNA-binding transcriptional regulator, LacI/PurR family [Microlunatus flavus]
MPRTKSSTPGAPTIVDVAREAGVSKGLVSLVINDRPGVADATRARVRDAADRLGWRPNLQARRLSTRTTYALGLVLRRDPRIVAADPFYPAFMAGIESVLSPEGRVLVLSVVATAEAEERAYRSFAADRRVDGVFLNDLRHGDDRVGLLAGLGLPGVLVGRLEEPGSLPAVVLDDRPGVTAAVRHLVDLGHRRVAYVGGDPALQHARHRRQAFEEAVAGHGLTPTAVVDTDFTMAGGAAATAALLGGDRPTAIVYANDPMAVAGLGVLQGSGVRVPDAMSVVGFDGTEIGRHTHPALTTIRSDPEQWGAAAARTLLELATSGHAPDVELPPAELVPRRSTGPAPDR